MRKSQIVYVHNKTNNIYIMVDEEVIDCTNSSEDKYMVLYHNLSGQFFVREREEFFEKFTAISPREVTRLTATSH